mgnify:CR=1 FL=1
MTDERLPAEILTDRLILRCWCEGDGPALKEAIDTNLAHLQRWMPWAMEEPSSQENMAARVLRFERAFRAGEDWPYGIFARHDRQVVGACGLHRRHGPNTLEIGYWVGVAHTRQGYATEAARALTATAFGLPQLEYVEIRCDPANVASAGVPKRLGYRLVEILTNDTVTPTGEPRDTMVWRIGREEYEAWSMPSGG